LEKNPLLNSYQSLTICNCNKRHEGKLRANKKGGNMASIEEKNIDTAKRIVELSIGAIFGFLALTNIIKL
jgi:hypothetical protein